MLTVLFWQDLNTAAEYALLLTRFSLSVFGIVAILLFCFSFRRNKNWAIVPIPIRIFMMSWLCYFTIMSTYVFATNTNPFEEWFRPLYGMGYFGTLWGLFWCIGYLVKDERTIQHKRLTNLYEKQVVSEVTKQIKDGVLDE